MIDEGEEPLQAAKRELEEEADLCVENIEHLITVYPSSGYTNEKVHIYFAKNFTKTQQKLDDTEEILSIEKISIEECLKRAKENYFKNASQNVAILLYYFKYLNGGINE